MFFNEWVENGGVIVNISMLFMLGVRQPECRKTNGTWMCVQASLVHRNAPLACREEISLRVVWSLEKYRHSHKRDVTLIIFSGLMQVN